MATMTYTDTLSIEECCNCGVIFAMPKDLRSYKLRHRDDPSRRSFYCPNGHDQYFLGQSPEQEAKELRAQLVHQRDQYEAELTAERRRRSALKGHLTKARKRQAAGVCPVPGWKRTVRQLADHMRTQHANFVVEEAD